MKKFPLMVFVATLITMLAASSANAQYCVQDSNGGVFVGGGVFMSVNNARFFSNGTDLANFLSTGTFGAWWYPVASCQAWGKAECIGSTSPYIRCTQGQRKVFSVSSFVPSIDFASDWTLITTIVCVDPAVTP